jgi:hypothetical protein
MAGVSSATLEGWAIPVVGAPADYGGDAGVDPLAALA